MSKVKMGTMRTLSTKVSKGGSSSYSKGVATKAIPAAKSSMKKRR